MNSIRKIAVAGCALIATSALLVSFTNDNGVDKNKKYQIMHHTDGEVITYDTVIPMSSTYTPEQFLIEKGLSSEDAEIITIPSITEMEIEGNAMKTIMREIEIDGDGSDDEIEIKVEVDENGNISSKKTVNGVEVEMTEEELNEIQSFHVQGDHEKVIHMHLDGEFPEDLEDNMKEIEIEMKKMVGDIDETNKEVRVMAKHIEMNSDHLRSETEWVSHDGQQSIIGMSSNGEDFTVVFITENYDESKSQQTKMMFENSTQEMDVYPNPNDGTFKIRFESDNNEKTTITVNDVSGKKVFEEKLEKFSGNYEKEINLKEFGSGMYTVTIQNGNNEEVQKVMIK